MTINDNIIILIIGGSLRKDNNISVKWLISRMIVPILAFFLCLDITYAYFTATASGVNSSTTTGQVILTFNSATTNGTTMTSGGASIGTLFPGDSLTVAAVVRNSGDVPIYAIVKLDLVINSVTVDSKYYTATGTQLTYTGSGPSTYYTTGASEIAASSNASAFNYVYNIPTNFGNTYQGTSASITISGYGIQKANISSAIEASNRLVNLAGGDTRANALPSAYQEVQYIQASGTQYIDTGITISRTDNAVLTMDMQFTSSTADQWAGAMTYLQYKYAYFNTTDRMTVEVNYNTESDFNQRIYKDSTIVQTFDRSSSYSNNVKLGIWRLGNVNGTWYDGTNQSAKVYSFKLTKNGSLARDLVPCYRKSDNVIGLFDLVTGTFFTNAGTGTFTKGANV